MIRLMQLPLLLSVLLLGGCGTLSYYSQAVRGHLALLQSSRPIEELLADPQTSAGLKGRLRKVLAFSTWCSSAKERSSAGVLDLRSWSFISRMRVGPMGVRRGQ